jgi:hypothetical protein
MGYADYRIDLGRVGANDSDHVEYMLDRYFHSGVPFVFQGGSPDLDSLFRRNLANRIRTTFGIPCHPLELFVCGSAHLGFSPVPEKLGNSFNPDTSDIDVALVSPQLFDIWWGELLAIDPHDPIRERVAGDLLNGFINPANVRGYTDIGRKWWNMFGAIPTDRARSVAGRIYRTHWFMQSYHRLAILKGKEKLEGARTQPA